MCEIRRSALQQQSHPEPARCRCTASHSWSAMPRCDAGARAHSRTQVGHAVHMRAGPLRRVQRRPLRERGPHAARHERRQQSGKARRTRRAQGEAKHGKEVWVRNCTERGVASLLSSRISALPQGPSLYRSNTLNISVSRAATSPSPTRALPRRATPGRTFTSRGTSPTTSPCRGARSCRRSYRKHTSYLLARSISACSMMLTPCPSGLTHTLSRLTLLYQ